MAAQWLSGEEKGEEFSLNGEDNKQAGTST